MEVIICDSHIEYAQRCQEMIHRLAEKHQIHINIEMLETGEQLLIKSESSFAGLDLLYLDYHMPGMNGVETAHYLRKEGCKADVVFYTEDETHAIEGYDVEALHYLLKTPPDDKKFEEVFLKAAARAEKRRVEMLTLSCAGEHRIISVGDILYFEVRSRIVTVHYYEEREVKTFEFYSSLSKIEEYLYGRGLLRIQSSYLVAEKYIAKRSRSSVTMITGDYGRSTTSLG